MLTQSPGTGRKLAERGDVPCWGVVGGVRPSKGLGTEEGHSIEIRLKTDDLWPCNSLTVLGVRS